LLNDYSSLASCHLINFTAKPTASVLKYEVCCNINSLNSLRLTVRAALKEKKIPPKNNNRMQTANNSEVRVVKEEGKINNISINDFRLVTFFFRPFLAPDHPDDKHSFLLIFHLCMN